MAYLLVLLSPEPPLPSALNLQAPLPEQSVEEEVLQETEEASRNGEQFHSAASTIEATDTDAVEVDEDPQSAFEFPAIAGAQSAMADAIRELQKNFGEKASQPTKFTRTNTGSPHKLMPKVNHAASPGQPGTTTLCLPGMNHSLLLSSLFSP